MSNYVICDATGLIVNRILLDDPQAFQPPPGCALVQESTQAYEPGGSIRSGTYTPPPIAPPPPTNSAGDSFLAQDFLAQLTVDDATKIQAAISGNVNMWLLWQSLVGQRDPILVSSDRFKAGWAALSSDAVLGAARCAAIAQALGIRTS